ncbi:hypothetical protein ACFSTC_34585 [Nonomuraea ferruginea]
MVSEESRDRDRTTKPSKYASAGIKHFWRVELEDDRPVAYTFELEPAVKAYLPTGIHRGRAAHRHRLPRRRRSRRGQGQALRRPR